MTLQKHMVAGIECWSVLIRHELVKEEAEARRLLRIGLEDALGGRVISPGRNHHARRWLVQLCYEDPEPTSRPPIGMARLSIPTTEDLTTYGLPAELVE